MIKIDVAVQSYKKPESLIYTLLSLKQVSEDLIDTIYIQDDLSGNKILNYYQSVYFQEFMKPIRVVVVENEKKGLLSKTMFTHEMIKASGKFWKMKYKSDNIRYQYAINHTDKKYLLLIHDDILFYKDVIPKYLIEIQKENIAIVGDLGQCWLCPYSIQGCSPQKVLSGNRPNKEWPLNYRRMRKLPFIKRRRRDCRINEWCCLINVEVAHKLEKEYRIYFGNYEKGGDVGAYWFDKIVELGYGFSDPLVSQHDSYYLHCWQGFSGHSVWIDQGKGKSKYDAEMIKEKLKSDFDFDFNMI